MYILNSTTIRRPNSILVRNSTQVAQNRTIGGDITRDYMGSNKRIWTLEYEDVNVTDYDTINTLYQLYLSNHATQTWEITEGNYAVSATNVHVDLLERTFTVKGDSYISSFTLTLTEA